MEEAHSISRAHSSFPAMAAWLVLLAFCSPLRAATTRDITVGDNFFSPANVTIQVGDTVRWNNASGGHSHNVTANNGSFASTTGSSFTFTHTFNSAGSVDYRCTLHSSQMKGTITVEAYGEPPPPSAADLSLLTVDAEAGTFHPGDDVAIDISIKNIGGQASPAASITYYASPNSSITASDTELGTDPLAALAANATHDYTAEASLPGDLAPGSYYIGAIIDINDASGGNDSNLDNSPIEVVADDNGQDFAINEGLNDAWYNPATPGQGFFITVFPDIQMMFLAWFTFDIERPSGSVEAVLGEPGHRWLTAFGPYQGDKAMLDVELTEGGVFDSAEPAVAQSADGTIEVEFTGCNAGLVHYDITSADVSGQIPIERIALGNVPFCETLAAGQ